MKLNVFNLFMIEDDGHWSCSLQVMWIIKVDADLNFIVINEKFNVIVEVNCQWS